MIINFHPKEIPSKKGLELIQAFSKDNPQQVFHSTEKSAEEWKEIISGTERLILIAPVYWWGAGYEFDKWAQDVFSSGFAFRYTENGTPEGLLNGRPFEFHLTHGTPSSFSTVMRENITTRMQQGIFGFCGAKLVINFYDLSE
jgi:NAD(P)H dehydrogenase (quinone)